MAFVKIILDENLSGFAEHWRPRTIAALNGQVPRGEHRTAADEEAEIIIFEPADVRNTGNVIDPVFTAPTGAPI